MKKQYSILYLLVIAFVFFLNISAHAYDTDNAHPKIMGAAINSSNYWNDWVIKGVKDEDNFPRWMRHFSPNLLGWADAITWALESSNNDYRWPVALNNLNKQEGYVALGHVAHLLQDMALPAHTRKDKHPTDLLMGDLYEDYVQVRIAKTGPPVLTGNLIPIGDLRSFFEKLRNETQTIFFSDGSNGSMGTMFSKDFKGPYDEKHCPDISDDKYYFCDANGRKIAYKPKAYRDSVDKGKEDKTLCTLDYEKILPSQFDELVPKAILYSASLINMYLEKMSVLDELKTNTHVYTKHFLTQGYYLDLVFDDPQQLATEVKVTGNNIGTVQLVYDSNSKQWRFENYYLGLTKPTSDLSYTFYITAQGQTTSVTKKITGYVDIFAQNLSPSGIVTGAFDFSWQGSCFDGYYVVDLIDSNNNLIWQHFTKDSSETKVPYTGPALVNGQTYYYNIQLRIKTNEGENFSLNMGSFQYSSPVSSHYTITDLGTLGGPESDAYGINDAGQVVGESATPSSLDGFHAFLYSDGTMKDLGTLGGSGSHASGINDAGQVVGGAATSLGCYHAFLYSDGVMKDLGTLGGFESFAYGINDAGQVVGYSDTSSGGRHAFLYSDGQLIDLNSLIGTSSGWELTCAYGINDKGQIVGTGLHNGNTRAFLMSPE